MNASIFHNESLDQAHFMKRLGTMLEAGFSLKDALSFLKTIEKPYICEWLESMEKGLEEGRSLISLFEELKFPASICAQLYFSSERGEFDQMLSKVGEQLLQFSNKKKQFKRLLHYPFILCTFLVGMLLMMRFYLLPHVTLLLDSTGTGLTGGSKLLIDVVYHSPLILSVLLVAILLLVAVYHYRFKKKSLMSRMSFWMKLPLIARFFELYWTHFYFEQWSDLIMNGSSLYEIVWMMKKSESTMLSEIGTIIDDEMEKGLNFHESLHTLPFIRQDAQMIIAHGEESGRMAVEMKVYSQQCLTYLNQKVEAFMETIQPVIFILVALMVIAIYGALMLPTFRLVEGF